jgi:DNA-binding NtrC family response regulator
VSEDLVRTVQRSDGEAEGSGASSRAHFFVVLEGARPLAGGSRHVLEGVDEVAVGRGARREHARDARGRKLTLAIPDPLMSGAHAKLSRQGGEWLVEDCGSTNGTFVDGERVTRATLRDGAVVDMGNTVFVLRLALPTPLSALADAESGALEGRDRGVASLLPDYEEALGSLVQMAYSRVFILLLGETGTGKEVLARGIHALSGRRGAFVPVNCGALSPNLVESQLFGHLKGSFSGALRDEPGFVLASDKGTLLLDEIGDLAKPSQAALLRVLQEGEVTPVGSTRPVTVNLRVVAATHRPIATLAQNDVFRADLYARLAGYTHSLRPLRDRKEDLGLLVAEILPRVAPDRPQEKLRIDVELARAALTYDWPLNVRELSQCLASTAVFATDGVLRLARAPEALRLARSAAERDAGEEEGESGASASAAPTAADEAVKVALLASLAEHRGNVSHVARALGRTRMQIHRWMRRFGIDPEDYRK